MKLRLAKASQLSWSWGLAWLSLATEKRKEKKEEKIMLFLVATNVITSRLPEHRPTGKPHAHANKISLTSIKIKIEVDCELCTDLMKYLWESFKRKVKVSVTSFTRL